MRHISFGKGALLAAVVGLLAVNSCIFDAKETKKDDKVVQPPAFLPLDKRDNVLKNLERAYEQRNFNQYDRLLDSGFIFHFAAVDIQDGNVTVSQWDRTAELTATENLFDPNFVLPSRGRVSKIDLTLTFPAGEDTWTPLTPPAECQCPGETWFEKTVSYQLSVTLTAQGVAEKTVLSNSIPTDASFVIRFAEVNGDSLYRIVIWRDGI